MNLHLDTNTFIQEETEKMIRDVRGTVVRKLEDHSLTANKLANYIGVLLSLGASPVELLSQYTRTHAQRAAKELKEYKSKIQSELAFADERNTFRMFHQVTSQSCLVHNLVLSRSGSTSNRFCWPTLWNASLASERISLHWP